VSQIVISDEMAAAMRGLRFLDTDRERLVFGIRARNNAVVLAAARTTWAS